MTGLLMAVIVVIFGAYALFVLVRLGLHQRLPLALGRISIDQIIDAAARTHGERPLFTCDAPADWSVPGLRSIYPCETDWTAARIKATAGFVAACLSEAGVERGDRVAILKRNHFDVHILNAAIIRAGGIACPINGQFPATDVSPYLELLGARVLITDAATLSRVLAGRGSIGGVQQVILTTCRQDSGEWAGANAARKWGPNVQIVWLEEALAGIVRELPAVPREPPDPLYLVHSSGTTGFPKAVTLTNAAQSHAVRGWLCYVHLSRTYDRGLVAVPNNHQAVILTFNSALLLGLQLHWMGACSRDDFSPQRAARELTAGRYTGFFAFPVAYTLLKEVDWTKYDITGMRVWASTADAAHMAIQRVFVQHGCAFKSLGLPLLGSIYLDAQGSSEVGTPSVIRYVSAYTRRFDRRIGRPGSSPFGPEIRITGPSGAVVRRGQAGRLEVRGRTLFAGYWNNDALTRQAMHGDWFFTGDIVRQERDNHLIQLDREVDVIHSAEGPLYSLLIEERLHTHPAVFDVCVYGAIQRDGTQRPAAAVAIRTGWKIGGPEITRQLNALLGEAEQLAHVEIIEWSDFPLGVTGKTLKRVFRERTERPMSELHRCNRPPGERSDNRECDLRTSRF